MPITGTLKTKRIIMDTNYVVSGLNLSESWLTVFDKVTNNTGNELSPLVVTITDFSESLAVKRTLDKHLVKNEHYGIDTVAATIFPDALYHFFKTDRNLLYANYINNLPRLKRADPANRRGTYFERLIAYDEIKRVNQLEIIIGSLLDKNNPRRSKLQAGIFDPLQDHLNDKYQKFPCLQHVTFYKSETGGLILNSFYAIQYLYQKAYGNWLGLINLGKFVANEAGLNFERFNCFIGIEQLEAKITKADAKSLLKDINTASQLQ